VAFLGIGRHRVDESESELECSKSYEHSISIRINVVDAYLSGKFAVKVEVGWRSEVDEMGMTYRLGRTHSHLPPSIIRPAKVRPGVTECLYVRFDVNFTWITLNGCFGD
jgi:hypothetical protein